MTRLVPLWLLAAGCVGDAPDEPVVPAAVEPSAVEDAENDSQSAISPTSYLERIATIQCEQAFACRDAYPGEATAFEATWSTAVPVCTANLVTVWNAAMIETEIAKGRIAFDGKAAVACLGGVAFGSCTEHWERGIQWADACYHVLVGTVPMGGSCDSSYACLSSDCDLAARSCR